MKSIHQQLLDLNQEVDKAQQAPNFWPQESETASRLSLLVRDEFESHRLTALSTFTIAVSGLINSHLAIAEPTDFDNKLMALRIAMIRQAVTPFYASDLSGFFNLSLSIVKSVASVLGIAPVVLIFEGKSVVDDIMKALQAGEPQLANFNKLLLVAEAAMQRMLSAALWAEVWSVQPHVDASTAVIDPVTAADQKAKVVARLNEFRKRIRAVGDPAFHDWPAEGFWAPLKFDAEGSPTPSS